MATRRWTAPPEVLAGILQRNIAVTEARVDLVGNHHGECCPDALPDLHARQPEDNTALRRRLEHQEVAAPERGVTTSPDSGDVLPRHCA